MSCDNCNRPSCGGCNKKCDPCKDACVRIEYVPGTACTLAITHGGCTTTFSLSAGVKACETDTHLLFDAGLAALVYQSERHDDTILLCDVLAYVGIGCLGDVELGETKPCDLMVFDPDGCEGDCPGNGGKWTNYKIPDTDEVLQPVDGFYKVVTVDSCGCLVIKKIPVGGN